MAPKTTRRPIFSRVTPPPEDDTKYSPIDRTKYITRPDLADYLLFIRTPEMRRKGRNFERIPEEILTHLANDLLGPVIRQLAGYIEDYDKLRELHATLQALRKALTDPSFRHEQEVRGRLRFYGELLQDAPQMEVPVLKFTLSGPSEIFRLPTQAKDAEADAESELAPESPKEPRRRIKEILLYLGQHPTTGETVVAQVRMRDFRNRINRYPYEFVPLYPEATPTDPESLKSLDHHLKEATHVAEEDRRQLALQITSFILGLTFNLPENNIDVRSKLPPEKARGLALDTLVYLDAALLNPEKTKQNGVDLAIRRKGPDGVEFKLTIHTPEAPLSSDITLGQKPMGAKPFSQIIIETTYKDDDNRRHPVQIVCERT